MSFAICALSVVPVRRQQDLLSEMTSQLLFGECYEILEEKPPFQRIRVGYDGYEGWIDGRQGEPIDSDEFESLMERGGEAPLLEEMSATATLGGDPILLVRGSSLPASVGGRKLDCGARSVLPSSEAFSPSKVESMARDYLHSPYCWGGRSPLGIDCSGLVQTIYRFFGCRLNRDSSDQSRQGREIACLDDALPGDLAFFDSASDGSSHVGLVVSGGIIHASGKVRYDLLTEEGIQHLDTSLLTHHLTSLRRHID